MHMHTARTCYKKPFKVYVQSLRFPARSTIRSRHSGKSGKHKFLRFPCCPVIRECSMEKKLDKKLKKKKNVEDFKFFNLFWY